MIRKYIAWLFRRPVAAFSVCISLVLVLQILIILSWNWGGSSDNLKYKVIQKSPVVRYKGVGGRILGLDPSLASMYMADEQGLWPCLDNREIIPFNMVNDDYCDCQDGSDEPSTSACPTQNFHCSMSSMLIPSSRVNDGVCDCCDGSDEYKQVHLLDRPDPTQQKKIQRFLPPCPNTCG